MNRLRIAFLSQFDSDLGEFISRFLLFSPNSNRRNYQTRVLIHAIVLQYKQSNSIVFGCLVNWTLMSTGSRH